MAAPSLRQTGDRSPGADCDVLICGASFAGLALARALAGSGAKVLLLDRYPLGARQTSACATPTAWLQALGLGEAICQTFSRLVVHTPRATTSWALPFTFSTFDYPTLCQTLFAQSGLPAEALVRATVKGREGNLVLTDRGEVRAPLVVDAAGWRRVLGRQRSLQPPNAPLSRGLEVHPRGQREELELWLDAGYVRAGYSWSFPAGEEVRVGVGSFWPRHHVREPTERLARELGLAAERFQGNWIPHRLREAVEEGVFFVGDAAGHCLPLTAEGIRTAFYFALFLGNQLRRVVAGEKSREEALATYTAFHNDHRWIFKWLLRWQRAIGYLLPTPPVRGLVRSFGNPTLSRWAFARYYGIAPPPREAPPAVGAARQAPAALSQS